MRVLFTTLLLLCFGSLQSQVEIFAPVPGVQFEFNCVEGDTLYNDPACYDCEPNTPSIFYGFEVIIPTGRKLLVRHPYQTRVRSTSYVDVTFDGTRSYLFDYRLSAFASAADLKAALDACPNPQAPPCNECPKIDTFQLVGSALQISLNTEDSLHTVDLSGVCDFCTNAAIVGVFREYFQAVSIDSVIIDNTDTLPDQEELIAVYVEGVRQRQGEFADYTISSDTVIKFNYTLSNEDVTIWWLESSSSLAVSRTYLVNSSGSTFAASLPDSISNLLVFVEGIKQEYGQDFDTTGNQINFLYNLANEDIEVWYLDNQTLLMYQEFFSSVSGTSILITANEGITPIINQATHLWIEGVLQQEGTSGDYTKLGPDITMNYSLINEDAGAWFILNINDNGILGDFRN